MQLAARPPEGAPALSEFVVHISGDALRVLDELAERRGVSREDVLRDALALEKWFEDVQRDGATVYVERPGGVRVVVPRHRRERVVR